MGDGLTNFKKEPSPTLPILNRLKNDPELYVRRSVANHVNDSAEDHPDIAVDLAASWKGQSKDVDWACARLVEKWIYASITFVWIGFALG